MKANDDQEQEVRNGSSESSNQRTPVLQTNINKEEEDVELMNMRYELESAVLALTTMEKFAKFELLPSSGFRDIISKPTWFSMQLLLKTLKFLKKIRNGDCSGTLYAQLNHCVTAFGKRLLKTWLARPLYHAESIKECQETVASLRGVDLPFSLPIISESFVQVARHGATACTCLL